MKKPVRRLGLIVAVLALVGAGAGLITCLVLYRSLKQVPKYYEQALRVEPEAQQIAGDELEKRVLQLHNEVIFSGQWEAVFTDEAINGWLAADLPEKFPDALPAAIRDPRVSIEDNKLRIACWHDHPQLKAVINLELEVYLTKEPNVVAIRICQARAGLIPLPLKEYLDLATEAARRGGITLRWRQIDEDPVALVTIPRNHEDFEHGEIRIETVTLQKGALFVAGATGTDLSAPKAASTAKVEAAGTDQPSL